jgi:phosphotriesterase-related protein
MGPRTFRAEAEMLANLKGKVLTVTGPIDPSQLGITLIHEHLLCDLSFYYEAPHDPKDKELATSPLQLSNLGWVRQHHLNCLTNLRLDEEDVAAREVANFLGLGGRSLVDATNVGLARNPSALLRIARNTGINVIAGSGYYIHASHPADMGGKTIDELRQEIVSDIACGIDGGEVRAGIIGEIGTSWPLHPDEEKCLRAAARAHKETGAPISIHPGHHLESPMQSVKILSAEGVHPHRVVMSHVDNRFREKVEVYRGLADTGCNLGFDTFGHEEYFALLGRQHPSDDLRIEVITQLIRSGYAEHIMVAQDCCYRLSITKYGGYGYGHILENIIPRFQGRGIREDDIYRMLVKNPQRFLAFQ